MKNLILPILLICIFVPTFGQTVQVKVIGVRDGDTIDVILDGEKTGVRMNGIDAPEKAQDFGQVSKKYLSDLVFSKTVVLKITGKDRYQRTLADVYLVKNADDTLWVNCAIVSAGLAWHYKQYSKDEVLASAEVKARKLKSGLWATLDTASPPQEPWLYRRKN